MNTQIQSTDSPNYTKIHQLCEAISITHKDLQRVFWLSGTPCGGKTTVSNAIAEKLNWNVYHLDEHWDAHKQRACPVKHPTYHAITRLTGDPLWLRPIQEQIRSELSFVAESFPLILEDVKAQLDSDHRNLIVDASVIPSCIEPFLPDSSHIYYLIPREDFQRHHYSLRPLIKPTLAKTTDPELAFSNWMTRDATYARWLETQVDLSGYYRQQVDGSLSIDQTIQRVLQHFLGDNKKA
jgi:hypothetical protein